MRDAAARHERLRRGAGRLAFGGVGGGADEVGLAGGVQRLAADDGDRGRRDAGVARSPRGDTSEIFLPRGRRGLAAGRGYANVMTTDRRAAPACRLGKGWSP